MLPSVLIIENNIPIIELYRRELMDSYQIIFCDDPVGVFQILSTKDIKVIILEPAFLGADGWKLLAKIKKNLAQKTIPVIVCTTQDDCCHAEACGADICLVKPTQPSELRDYLAQFITA